MQLASIMQLISLIFHIKKCEVLYTTRSMRRMKFEYVTYSWLSSVYIKKRTISIKIREFRVYCFVLRSKFCFWYAEYSWQLTILIFVYICLYNKWIVELFLEIFELEMMTTETHVTVLTPQCTENLVYYLKLFFTHVCIPIFLM